MFGGQHLGVDNVVRNVAEVWDIIIKLAVKKLRETLVENY
jgi:hypothetical protein